MNASIDLDRSQQIYSDVCSRCKHLDDSSVFGSGTIRCKAFRGGIPEEIWDGRNPHTASFGDDGGVLFERLSLGEHDGAK